MLASGSVAGARRILASASASALGAALGAVLAAVSVGIAVTDGPAWAAVVTWVIGAASVVVDAVEGWIAGPANRPGGGLGRQLQTRVLLLVTAGVGATRTCPGQRTGIWIGVVVVLGAVVVEPVVARAQPRAEVAGLCGLRDAPGLGVVRWLVPATTAVLLLAGLLGIVSVGLLVRALLPVLALTVLGAAVAIGALNARDRPARRVRLRRALEQFEPRFAVYTGRDDGGAYQVAMWLPELDQLGLRYVIVARRTSALPALTALTSAPVVVRDSWRDLDDVIVPGLGAAFYVNAVASNSNFVTYRALTHVYLGHGDSDKPLSHHPQHAMFDRVFVAGPAAIERYARHGVRMRPDAFVVVGRPQLAALHRADPAATGRPTTVLYAPTWAGYNRESSHSSLSHGVEIVRELLARGMTVVFRPHPFSRELSAERERAAAVDALLAEDAARTGRAHRFGPDVDGAGFIETANLSDAMVADISSVLVDYLAADKPMAVVVAGAASPAEFVDRFPVARGAYLLTPGPGGRTEALDGLLGDDPNRAQREAIRDYYLGGLDGPAAVAAFLAAARAAIDDGG